MSDLVKRLRLAGLNPAEYDSTGWTAKTCGLVSSAADRIEQLERVLLQARMVLSSASEYTPSDIDVIFPEQIAAIDEALK